jgi:ornithine--oxo-acid transaminase
MCNEWDLAPHNAKPDIVTLGKCLSAGVTPVSGIMADNAIMDVIEHGDFSSTYGGNPMGMAIAKTSLQILVDEDLVGNS